MREPALLLFSDAVHAAEQPSLPKAFLDGTGQWPKFIPGWGAGKDELLPNPEELKTFRDFMTTLAQENGGSYHLID